MTETRAQPPLRRRRADSAGAAFGALMRRHRLEAGLTQEQLAERSGLSREAISLLERGGRRRPHPHTVETLAAALGLVAAERSAFEAAARPDRSARETRMATRAPLPLSPTPLIGRECEMAAAVSLLRTGATRLLTLTGPGGVGKTRLAVQVAAELAGDYADGVAFVSLASLGHPSLLPAVIAGALGLSGAEDRAPRELLLSHLRGKRLLLLLDNVEQIVSAAPLIADLLGAGPHLAVLATSRVPLRLRAERLLTVPPLALPDPGDLPSADELRQVAAVALFLQQARAVAPGFTLTAHNAAAVAGICRRLDGLPLALELAAARVTVLPPVALLERLERRLPLLVGGAQDLPARQQTMRDAIAWSYDLLHPGEQALFRRLCVFAGGCTLEALEDVCPDDTDIALAGVLAGVEALVAASMVRSEGAVGDRDEGGQAAGTPRFDVLGTIREYGLECLDAAGERGVVQHRHALYYLGLAERAQPRLREADQAVWLARLAREHDNLRAALSWARSKGELGLGLRLASALAPFWAARGHLREGRAWLDDLLALQPGGERAASPAVRAAALQAAGLLAQDQHDSARAAALFEDSLALYRDTGDADGAFALLWLLSDLAHAQGDRARARALHKESVALRRAVTHSGEVPSMQQRFLTHGEIVDAGLYGDRGHAALLASRLAAARGQSDPRILVEALLAVGGDAFYRSDYARARALLEEGLGLARVLSDVRLVALLLRVLGAAAREQSAYERAKALFDEALHLAKVVEDARESAWVLLGLSDVARDQGDGQGTMAPAEQSLALFEQLEVPSGRGFALNNLGLAAWLRGDMARAAEQCEQSLAMWRTIGARNGAAEALISLGLLAGERGDSQHAAALYAESLRLARRHGRLITVVGGLEGMAGAAVALEDPAQAAPLLGAAEALRAAHGCPLPPARRPAYDHAIATGRAALGDDMWEAAWASGTALTARRAVAQALRMHVPGRIRRAPLQIDWRDQACD